MSSFQQIAAGVTVTLALAAPAVAQQQRFPQVTVVTKSGETVQGGLQDLARDLFYIRTSQHSDRRIPRGDVALLDFTGGGQVPAAESSIAENTQLLVLRDGTSVRGQFLDIRGGGTENFNLQVVFRAQGGRERVVPIGQVSRLYLAHASGQGNTPSQGQGASGSGFPIRVPANQRWTDTGISVRKGDRVSFNASGQVQLSNTGSDTATPNGAASGRRPSGPMPNVLAGALIGRAGPFALFGIGGQTVPLTMPADGRLFLGVNDDEVGDNRGEFTVDVRPESSSMDRRR